MAYIGQDIQHSGFDKPYFMAWFAHSAYLWFFLLVGLMWYIRRRKARLTPSAADSPAAVHVSLPFTADSSRPSRYPRSQYVKTAFVVSILAFFMIYLWYLSLPRTSVAVNTSIYQSSSIVVYVLSVILFRESVGVIKVVSVAVSLLGVFLISFGDQQDVPQEGDAAGYICLIASTVLYAVYEVVYRYMGVDERNSKTEALYHALQILAFVGVFTLVLLWPGLLIVHFTGWEVFQWPTGEAFLLVFLMALCESIFNLCLLTGVFLTSPLFISVGSMLAIPTAIIVDHLLGRLDLVSMSYCGIACVVVGFLGLNFAEWWHQKLLESKESGEL